jgi:hypothetical protein
MVSQVSDFWSFSVSDFWSFNPFLNFIPAHGPGFPGFGFLVFPIFGFGFLVIFGVPVFKFYPAAAHGGGGKRRYIDP